VKITENFINSLERGCFNIAKFFFSMVLCVGEETTSKYENHSFTTNKAVSKALNQTLQKRKNDR